MRFWTREIAGWLLVAAGLFVFYTCYELLVKKDPQHDPPRIFEAGVLTPIGFIIFRGGIHLLKVAVAARICAQAQERVAENRPSAGAPRRTPAAPLASRPTAPVVPMTRTETR
jgi:hypothetical protein